MNKSVMNMLIMGFLALCAFAREQKFSLSQITQSVKTVDLPEGSPLVFVREDIKPYVNYLKTIPDFAGSWFSIPYKTTDTIAVQVVRSSDRYFYDEPPVLVLCDMNDMKCLYDNETKSLSFEISGDKITKTSDELFNFVIYGVGNNNETAHGVVVGLYVCVSKSASLSTCTSTCTKDCYHGTPSDVMDACVCYEGYTDDNCETMAGVPPTWGKELNEGLHLAYCIVLPICWFVILVSIMVTLVMCIRKCVRLQRMSDLQHNASYYPLGAVPPPPLPQEVIEIPVAPSSRAIYTAPPVAPVNQVPVFVMPPVPKN